MKRHLLSFVAVAAFASFAGAQQHQPPMDSTHARMQHDSAGKKGDHAKGAKADKAHAKKAGKVTTSSSGGEVDLSRGGPGYAPRAVARDFVGADESRADDLFRREQMMDAKCGKSRERCGKP